MDHFSAPKRLKEKPDMPKAIWNNVVIAESANTEMVEGNHYFPPESLRR